MKRSRINDIIRAADSFIHEQGFTLPPFGYWTVEHFCKFREQSAGIIGGRLGWDVSDFGTGDFNRYGLVEFTLRNGVKQIRPRAKGMLYAEKLIVCRPGQTKPMHRHHAKTEDIINRGGGRGVFQLYASDANGEIDSDSDVLFLTDGMDRAMPPGGLVRLGPGESITLEPGIWHRFWAEDQDVLFGQVSTVNDDLEDNVFVGSVERYATIEEDVPPWRLLVSDYSTYLRDDA